MEILIKSSPSVIANSQDVNDSVDHSQPRIDFSPHLDVFAPGKSLHKSKRNLEILGNLMDNSPIVLADLLAAQTAALYSANVFKDGVVKQALRCCRDILLDRGFTQIDSNILTEHLANTNNIIVAIVGCQSWGLLEQRVKAAVRVCIPLIELKRDITVCFSGSHPTDRKLVAIPNEANEMRIIFEDEISRRKLKKIANLYYKLITESYSDNTAVNIGNIAKTLSAELKRPSSFFLVTSSFHIPRLYDEFEKQILLRKSDEKETYSIQNIVLVGAEGFINGNISYKPSQVKLLMFEIYRYFIGNEQFREHLGLRK